MFLSCYIKKMIKSPASETTYYEDGREILEFRDPVLGLMRDPRVGAALIETDVDGASREVYNPGGSGRFRYKNILFDSIEVRYDRYGIALDVRCFVLRKPPEVIQDYMEGIIMPHDMRSIWELVRPELGYGIKFEVAKVTPTLSPIMERIRPPRPLRIAFDRLKAFRIGGPKT